ncbi:hypothetical protein EBESD8_24740 [Rhodococcus aetherivorans]|nr:hypothetical protein EBESD8_24740 [Rhodococcus aetherivorans]
MTEDSVRFEPAPRPRPSAARPRPRTAANTDREKHRAASPTEAVDRPGCRRRPGRRQPIRRLRRHEHHIGRPLHQRVRPHRRTARDRRGRPRLGARYRDPDPRTHRPEPAGPEPEGTRRGPAGDHRARPVDHPGARTRSRRRRRSHRRHRQAAHPRRSVQHDRAGREGRRRHRRTHPGPARRRQLGTVDGHRTDRHEPLRPDPRRAGRHRTDLRRCHQGRAGAAHSAPGARADARRRRDSRPGRAAGRTRPCTGARSGPAGAGLCAGVVVTAVARPGTRAGRRRRRQRRAHQPGVEQRRRRARGHRRSGRRVRTEGDHPSPVGRRRVHPLPGRHLRRRARRRHRAPHRRQQRLLQGRIGGDRAGHLRLPRPDPGLVRRRLQRARRPLRPDLRGPRRRPGQARAGRARRRLQREHRRHRDDGRLLQRRTAEGHGRRGGPLPRLAARQGRSRPQGRDHHVLGGHVVHPVPAGRGRGPADHLRAPRRRQHQLPRRLRLREDGRDP